MRYHRPLEKGEREREQKLWFPVLCLFFHNLGSKHPKTPLDRKERIREREKRERERHVTMMMGGAQQETRLDDNERKNDRTGQGREEGRMASTMRHRDLRSE